MEVYGDPQQGQEVARPGGYARAWGNSQGEYILSDDPDFDPNAGAGSVWQPLQRRSS